MMEIKRRSKRKNKKKRERGSTSSGETKDGQMVTRNEKVKRISE